MPPDRSSFTALNISSAHIPSWMGSFTLSAAPNTDLWRKPPAQNISTAPVLFTALRNPFIAAEVTVCADWELEWDQGGLVIFAGSPQGIRSVPSDSTPQQISHLVPTATGDSAPPPPLPPPYASSIGSPNAPKWVKLSLEYTSSAPQASSVVATADGADWCSSALPPQYADGRRSDLRIKMERIGYALWLWYLDDSADMAALHPGSTGAMASPPAYGHIGTPRGGLPGVWRKLREVTWFFWGVEDKAVRVGVYACRPVSGDVGAQDSNRRLGGARDLCVEFDGLEIL